MNIMEDETVAMEQVDEARKCDDSKVDETINSDEMIIIEEGHEVFKFDETKRIVIGDETEKQIKCEDTCRSEAEGKIKADIFSEAEPPIINRGPDDLCLLADPYAYLKRDEFTSEKFKIEIRDMPRHYGFSELKKLLNVKLKLNSSKIKTPHKGRAFAHVCYVSFRNERDKTKAIEVLNGFKWKGKTLKVSEGKPAPDPLVMKRKENYQKSSKVKGSTDNDKPQEERLKDGTIPYWNIPYEEQLTMKHECMKQLLQKFGEQLAHANSSLTGQLEASKAKNAGLPCELWPMRRAEPVDGYRNKCEFTVGMDQETGLSTVGFRLGSYVRGLTDVGPVQGLRHIPDRMKVAVKLFEEFVRASDLPVFNPETQSGNWRQLLARTTTASNELMLVVGVHPQQLPQETLEKLRVDLVVYFAVGEGRGAKVTSLYYQNIVKRQQGDQPVQAIHLWGATHNRETLLGLTFTVSPEAFFQINIPAAEVLYSSAIELASPTLQSTVVDVCCGTGTIGLCFAKRCTQVLGLECIPQAIEDAKQNAISNNIDNCEFFVGRAEDILHSVVCRATQDDIIAIVDPPRSGLHQKAIQQLRKIKNLRKLVYISCDMTAALKNFVELGRPCSKTLHGPPLVPVRAVPVDMFPHTKHCEMIIYFERLDE